MPVNDKFARSESLTDRALKQYEAETRQKTPFQIRRLGDHAAYQGPRDDAAESDRGRPDAASVPV
jgi:hypothetical protein